MPTVVVVDDHLLIAESLQAALQSHGLTAVVIEPQEFPSLLSELLRAQADLVLLDLDLGRYGDATPLIGPLVRAGSKVLTVTGLADRLRIAAALEAGAIGYQPKSAGVEALLVAASLALAAAGPLDADLREQLLAELGAARRRHVDEQKPFLRLTDRERSTLDALGEGLSVRDIADQWVVSEATVRTHVRGVLSKLGTGSQLGAVAMAFRHGWMSNRTRWQPPPATAGADLTRHSPEVNV
jgi:two-component system nitrate/nitrite response regulator NarL